MRVEKCPLKKKKTFYGEWSVFYKQVNINISVQVRSEPVEQLNLLGCRDRQGESSFQGKLFLEQHILLYKIMSANTRAELELKAELQQRLIC